MLVPALHSRAVPEHGALGFKDEDSGRSTSVLEIANSVGYEPPLHLAHMFRWVLGRSPDEWRRG